MVIALEIVERALAHRANHVRDVLFRMDVANARLGTLLGEMVADRVHEVRLSEAHAAIDEKRVVGDAWVFGDLDRCRARQLVRLPGHEAVEGKTAV